MVTKFIQMKTASTLLSTTALFLSLVVGPLRAQDDVVKAVPNDAAAKSADQAAPTQRDDNPQVRIDDTGVYVGGENPVDIKIPKHRDGPGRILGPLLPIISVLTVFGMPVAIVGFILIFKHRRDRLLHETLRTMVEKGVPIPPELIARRGASSAIVAHAEPRGNRDLRAGLILIAVGVGVLMLGGAAGMSRLGLVPLFVGVALLVVWLIGLIGNKRKNTLAQ